ncbi:Rbr5: rubrerythrin [Desulfosarcina cetonica]|uniref:ferritin-like domain-containing protein n=1 Tax=Desulfosarcina cetonica TaxID=90730 RepID=UPI0006D29202|nr:ferritin family protein [Desulfosarcina cetonica]VTR69988.1 Rbr5: rubrerythrin [Desulfosarcina cetonica]
MSYDFNADDVFEMAMQIERNGATFYRDAAANIADQNAKEFLLDLAAMEDDHEKTFAAMRKGLGEAEKTQTVFDPQNEAAAYLKALADTRIFFKKEMDTSSLEAILKAAILAEKDSIVFYLGMKDLVPESLGQSRLDDIIKAEMSHIKLLSHRLVATRS